jgi:hypothetical protein
VKMPEYFGKLVADAKPEEQTAAAEERKA